MEVGICIDCLEKEQTLITHRGLHSKSCEECGRGIMVSGGRSLKLCSECAVNLGQCRYCRVHPIMDLQEIVDEVNKYQANKHFHPLTCTCGNHVKLEPVIRGNLVVLKCPLCFRVRNSERR